MTKLITFIYFLLLLIATSSFETKAWTPCFAFCDSTCTVPAVNSLAASVVKGTSEVIKKCLDANVAFIQMDANYSVSNVSILSTVIQNHFNIYNSLDKFQVASDANFNLYMLNNKTVTTVLANNMMRDAKRFFLVDMNRLIEEQGTTPSIPFMNYLDGLRHFSITDDSNVSSSVDFKTFFSPNYYYKFKVKEERRRNIELLKDTVLQSYNLLSNGSIITSEVYQRLIHDVATLSGFDENFNPIKSELELSVIANVLHELFNVRHVSKDESESAISVMSKVSNEAVNSLTLLSKMDSMNEKGVIRTIAIVEQQNTAALQRLVNLKKARNRLKTL